MSAKLYIEGGGDSKELHTRCREAFSRLLKRCGFEGRMPRLIACGSRNSAFDDFATAHANATSGLFVAMLVDSEDPLPDVEATWSHLKVRDNWSKPTSADDEQVLLMTTCMETWILVDRNTLESHYGRGFRSNALPSLVDMEVRSRDSVQTALVQATRGCSNKYMKGSRSFELVGLLNPVELKKHLPSFVRIERILSDRL